MPKFSSARWLCIWWQVILMIELRGHALMGGSLLGSSTFCVHRVCIAIDAVEIVCSALPFSSYGVYVVCRSY